MTSTVRSYNMASSLSLSLHGRDPTCTLDSRVCVDSLAVTPERGISSSCLSPPPSTVFIRVSYWRFGPLLELFHECNARFWPDELFPEDPRELSPIRCGATCLKNRRRVGREQQMMKRFASTMLEIVSDNGMDRIVSSDRNSVLTSTHSPRQLSMFDQDPSMLVSGQPSG